jgi:AcrR family transcriptional regulator
MARTGRRPGRSGSDQAILAAARAAFTERGFAGATVREIAAAAGVDPALVHHYFGTKEALFAAALQLPADPAVFVPALLAPGVDGLGERLLRALLQIWEDAGGANSTLIALVRGAVSHERSAAMLREFVSTAVLGRLAAALDTEDAALRAALVGSQVVGLAMARYVVRVEPLASADVETVVAAVAPTLQRYLVGELSSSTPPRPG